MARGKVATKAGVGVEQASRGRIEALDIARTLALACMVVFHFTFDLMLFGYVAPGTVYQGFWPYFARGIAGSFLFLAGVSLWLAHGRGIRWPGFWRRLGMLVAAALVVSVATWASIGDAWIRWGILHAIAAASLIGLLFLRVPGLLTLALAVVVFLAPQYLRADMFNAEWLLWVGLSTEVPPMVDYLPLAPWLAPLLAGVAVARWVPWDRLRTTPTPLSRALGWPGQHGLAVYLIHQPVLFGAIWVYTYLTSG